MQHIKPILTGLLIGTILSLGVYAFAAPTAPTGGGSPTAPVALCQNASGVWSLCNPADVLGNSAYPLANGYFTALTAVTMTISGTVAGNLNITNDNLLLLGTGGDNALVNRSTALGANTALTSVLIGTPVTAATPADSLLISNVTASGDIAWFLNDGAGNSWEYLRFDGSADLIVFNEASSDIDFRVDGTNANLFTLDAGQNSAAFGAAPTSGASITLSNSSTRSYVTSVGFGVHEPAATFNDNAASGTMAVAARHLIGIPTLTANDAGGRTYSRASTLYIAGRPTASTNVVISEGFAFQVAAGNILHQQDTASTLGFELTNASLSTGQMMKFTLTGTSAAATQASSGSMLTLSATNTGWTGATQSLSGIYASGANANASVVLTGQTISVTNTGTTNTNIGLTLTASGGSTANTALNITAGNIDLNSTGTILNVGAAGNDWTANNLIMSNAAGTSNMVLNVTNTSNTAAAEHSIVDIAVGGTTSLGDPQLRLTIPSGTSWYAGVDNSDSDKLEIGVGTAIGTTPYITLDPRTTTTAVTAIRFDHQAPTIASATGATYNIIDFSPSTISFSGTTQMTSLQELFRFSGATISNTASSALTIDKVAQVRMRPSIANGTNLVITHNSGIRVVSASASTNGGVSTNVSGIYVENQATAGTSNYGIYVEDITSGVADYGIYIAGGDTYALWVDSDTSRFDGRVLNTQGADVASGTSLTLGSDGNSFEITGTTQIDQILSTGWQEGAVVTLIFNESVTVRHGVATSGSNITILLSGAGNLSATANDTLTLILSSTTAGGQAWREVARTVI